MLCKFKIGPILLYFLLEEQHWSWWWLARFPARSKTRNWLATPHPLDLLFCHVQGVRGSRAWATCLEHFHSFTLIQDIVRYWYLVVLLLVVEAIFRAEA